jgi:hypothetical protein
VSIHTRQKLTPSDLDALCRCAGVPATENEWYKERVKNLVGFVWLCDARGNPALPKEDEAALTDVAEIAAKLNELLIQLSGAARRRLQQVADNYPFLLDSERPIFGEKVDGASIHWNALHGLS